MRGGDWTGKQWGSTTLQQTESLQFLARSSLIAACGSAKKQIINDISTDAWYRLVCSVYLVKHETLFQHTIKSLTVQLNGEMFSLQRYESLNVY